jgi:hypothetical protein
MKKMIVTGGIVLLAIIVPKAMRQINIPETIHRLDVFVEEVKVRHETSTKSCINWKSVLGDYSKAEWETTTNE